MTAAFILQALGSSAHLQTIALENKMQNFCSRGFFTDGLGIIVVEIAVLWTEILGTFVFRQCASEGVKTRFSTLKKCGISREGVLTDLPRQTVWLDARTDQILFFSVC